MQKNFVKNTIIKTKTNENVPNLFKHQWWQTIYFCRVVPSGNR
jgi:hypothetical protein